MFSAKKNTVTSSPQPKGNSVFFQPKLTINQPNDVYEHEADAVAEKVMRKPDDSKNGQHFFTPSPVSILQRDAIKEEDRKKHLHRKCAHCEEEEKQLQRKESNNESVATTQTESYINSLSGGNSLNPGEKNFFESKMGYDFSNVRIHNDSSANQSAKNVNALAYTHGNNIVFGSGQYQSGTHEGKKLMAHELTHVVQQNILNKSIQRVVTPSAVQFHSFNQLRQMHIPTFIAYIQRQSDWFTNPSLTGDQRQRIRRILYFINDNVAAYFRYVQIWLFDQLLNDVASGEVSDENADALRTYASAASGEHIPFAVSNSPVAVSTALEKGKDMVKLRRSFHDYVLHDALNETQFLRLRNRAGFVDDVINYHDNAHQQPIFQAEDAADFMSFISYNHSTSRHPLQYESTVLLNKVRNFHRFQKRALDRLVTNYADHSHTKPVTLILHSALDHNGAFHHDENLTRVITNNHMLTLMIEGFEQLSGYQSLISTLANDYGQQHGANFLIDQVMFAGHGNAQTIELAGTIHEDPVHPGHIEEIGQGLDVSAGQDAATRSLLQDVLRFMANPANGTGGMSPHNRVVFNACLTGSNVVALAVNNGNAAAASTEIQAFITANPSLSTYLHNIANSSITSIGSRASFGQVSLINSSNELDIISPEDPALTSASPLTYAERGIEPTGTLRSALESWANDRPGTIAAMQRRVTHAATSWSKKLIKKAYEIILASYQNNGNSFRLIALAVDRISEMENESNAIVPNGTLSFFHGLIGDGINTDASTLLNALTTTSEWNNNATRLALLQVWMMIDATKQADFMTKLGTLTCNFSVRFVDIGFIAGQALMNILLTGAASGQAKFKLALIGVLGDNNNADARTFLMGLLAGGQHFPAALNIVTALGGASTETAILTKLGVFSAAVAAQTANIHIGSAVTNTVFVERLNVPGTVSNPYGVTVYEQPDVTSAVLANLNFNDPVEITGRTGDFYAIQFSTGGAASVSAFVSRFSVDQLIPYSF